MGAPRLVPVRIKSCAEADASESASKINKSAGFFQAAFNMGLLPLIVEPEFYRNPAMRGRGAKAINTLNRSDRRLVQRRNTTGLFDADVRGCAVRLNVKKYIHAMSSSVGTNFHRVPVVGNFIVDDLHVPPVAASEISTALEVEPAFSMGRGEPSKRAAHGPAFAVGHYMRRNGHSLWPTVRRSH